VDENLEIMFTVMPLLSWGGAESCSMFDAMPNAKNLSREKVLLKH